MKIQFKKNRRNVTLIAMSDIAFLLLIFLIVIANVKTDNEIILPVFKYSVKAYPEDMFLLIVNKNGEILTEGNTVSPEQLSGYITNAYNKGIRIIGIYADKETDYQYVSNVLHVLKASAISNIILITEKTEE